MRSCGWGPHNGISVLIRRGRDQSLLVSSLPGMRTQREGTTCNLRRGPSPRNQIGPHLILDFLTCNTLRSKFLWLSHPVYGLLLWQLPLIKTRWCAVFVRLWYQGNVISLERKVIWQNPFYNQNTLGIGGHFLNMIKGLCLKTQLASYLRVKEWMLYPKIRNKARMLLPPNLFNIVVEVLVKEIR